MQYSWIMNLLSINPFGEIMRHFMTFCISFVCLLVFCSPLVAGDKPTVFVSILPQKYFVEQLADDLVDVEVMVKPGASPATYEPKVSQMRKLASSAIYFSIGVPFERAWLERIAGVNSHMRIARTDAGIEKIAMEKHLHDHDAEHSGHGDDEDEAYGGTGDDGLDPHIWLSPALVREQAATIATALIELLPAESQKIDANLQSFYDRIEQLDVELKGILKDKTGMRFMVFHPSWGYFAQTYGIKQIPIEFEGKGPKSSQLKDLILFAREQEIHVIFAQPQFSTKSAQLVAREIKGQVITVDPLAENWLKNMKQVAEKFRDAIQ